MAKGDFKLGLWAFVIGLIIAAIIALIGSTNQPWVVPVLAVLGIIVGLFNVTGAEVQKFLLAAVAFLLSFGSLASLLQEIPFLASVGTFFALMQTFMAPAVAVVAIQALYFIAKD